MMILTEWGGVVEASNGGEDYGGFLSVE